MVAQIGLTDTHTDISHWIQSCNYYKIPMVQSFSRKLCLEKIYMIPKI